MAQFLIFHWRIESSHKVCIIHNKKPCICTPLAQNICLVFNRLNQSKNMFIISHIQVSICTLILRTGPPAAYPVHAGTNDTQSAIHMSSS